MRAWVLVAASLALCAWLVWRVVGLERRLETLSNLVGPPAPPSAAPHPAVTERMTSVEDELDGIKNDMRALQQRIERVGVLVAQAPAVAPVRSAAAAAEHALTDQHIVAVVEREQARVRERQLLYQRTRWLEWRNAALEDFAKSYHLSPWQKQQLHQLLSDEVEDMVDILRRPDAAENPERVVKDWKKKLDETDEDARHVLEPAQVAPWDQARAIERRLLWPWLGQ